VPLSIAVPASTVPKHMSRRSAPRVAGRVEVRKRVDPAEDHSKVEEHRYQPDDQDAQNPDRPAEDGPGPAAAAPPLVDALEQSGEGEHGRQRGGQVNPDESPRPEAEETAEGEGGEERGPVDGVKRPDDESAGVGQHEPSDGPRQVRPGGLSGRLLGHIRPPPTSRPP
jgi:hypothetical protein